MLSSVTSTLWRSSQRILLNQQNVQSSIVLRAMLSAAPNEEIKKKIDSLVKHNKIVVFMKGVPDSPKCGFSNAVVQILRMHGVKYEAHDVLADENIRQGIKDYSSWPTIPQIFINGEFVGGCDILLQMHQNGELIEALKKAGVRSALLDAALKEDDKATKK